MKKFFLLVLICIGTAHNIQAVSFEAGLALLRAAKNNDLEMTKRALNSGVNIEVSACDGSTPLIFASWGNSVEVTKLLLNKRANKESRNCDGWTPLIYASLNNSVGAAKLLLAYGANYKLRTYKDATALDHARNAEIRQILSSPNPYRHPGVSKVGREVVVEKVGKVKKHLLAREAGVRDLSRFRRKKKRDNLEPTPAVSLLRNLPTRAK